MSNDSSESWASKAVTALTVITLLAIVAAALIGALWVLPSYFEAKSFNRLTGAHATTWDAMWVELRVQEGAKP